MHNTLRTIIIFQREAWKQNKCKIFKDKHSEMQVKFKQCEISDSM